jgi:hypothetical protein
MISLLFGNCRPVTRLQRQFKLPYKPTQIHLEIEKG